MSDLFKDSTYEEFDWLTKAVEPFIFSPNDFLSQAPDKYVLSYEDILELSAHFTRTFISELNITQFIANKFNIEMLPPQYSSIPLYVVDIDKETCINIDERSIQGNTTLRKIRERFSEEHILQFAVNSCRKLGDVAYAEKAPASKRIDEIIAIIGADPNKTTSIRKKAQYLKDVVSSLLKENKWDIRNYELMTSMIDWIFIYVIDGNLAALSNFTKLKCMTHNKKPIYSIQVTV